MRTIEKALDKTDKLLVAKAQNEASDIEDNTVAQPLTQAELNKQYL